MNLKVLNDYSFYSLKVLIGAVILIFVTLVAVPQVLKQKLGKKTLPGE